MKRTCIVTIKQRYILYQNQNNSDMIQEFVKKIVSLDNVHQWEERDSIIKETVSQHSFKVATFAIFILDRLENENCNVMKGQDWLEFRKNCVEYAVLHDFDEAILGRDISHTVKYNGHNGDKIRKEIDDFVNYEIERLGFNLIGHEIGPDVKTFVKLCDWLALLSFIKRNKAMGVRTFDKEQIYCQDKAMESIVIVQSMLNKVFYFESFKSLTEMLNYDIL